MTPIWHVGKYSRPQRRPHLSWQLSEEINTDFSPPEYKALFFLIVFANTDQMKLHRRGY